LVTNFGQLHELGFTVGSPIEGATHHKEKAFLTMCFCKASDTWSRMVFFRAQSIPARNRSPRGR
jgi:hypothetical protein